MREEPQLQIPEGLRENVLLAPMTTFGIGGPARYFLSATTEEQVVRGLRFAESRGLSTFLLGGGSNLLVSDKGFDGLVIRVDIKGIDLTATDNGGTIVTAAAGEDWDAFVRFCVQQDLAGVECLSGIPGSVGATPIQNVGAYGQEVAETISAVRCLDRESGETKWLTNSECGFGYRTSIFNTNARGRYVVFKVRFVLTRGGRPKLAYRELAEAFSSLHPSLADVRDAVLRIRRAKSMVISQDDPNSRSAGSFFKNPLIGIEHYERLQLAWENVPSFPAAEGKVKVPAAWLVERAGFRKGFSIGRAGISENHALALVNRGGASADEILALKEAIVRAVLDRFQIELIPEPVFIGF